MSESAVIVKLRKQLTDARMQRALAWDHLEQRSDELSAHKLMRGKSMVTSDVAQVNLAAAAKHFTECSAEAQRLETLLERVLMAAKARRHKR